MDFTVERYGELMRALKGAGYRFQSVGEFVEAPLPGKVVVLRHDVDDDAERYLRTAVIEHELGIHAVYYFRAIPCSWKVDIIRQIAAMGHEVGYHYESLTTTGGDMEAAYADFCHNLAELRKLVPVKTICMHGSASSPHDSKDIWHHYNYRDLGIIAEPYFDLDFNELFYLTDTGRRWDGFKVSVRDKIPEHQERWNANGWVYRHTGDIIAAAKAGTLPERIHMTVHSGRWTVGLRPWLYQLVMQRTKNVVKRALIAYRRARGQH